VEFINRKVDHDEIEKFKLEMSVTEGYPSPHY